jgi:hypothetical protein
VLRGPTRGRPWAPAGVRSQLHLVGAKAGVRRRFAPHQLRQATRSRCHVKECRCWSSSASSATPTSRSRRSPTRDRQHRDRSRVARAPGTNDSGYPRPFRSRPAITRSGRLPSRRQAQRSRPTHTAPHIWSERAAAVARSTSREQRSRPIRRGTGPALSRQSARPTPAARRSLRRQTSRTSSQGGGANAVVRAPPPRPEPVSSPQTRTGSGTAVPRRTSGRLLSSARVRRPRSTRA